MASNIGTLAEFATQSMKVSPGEQADSIWGAKIADNTGHLWHRPIYLPGEAGDITYFQKQASHNCFRVVGHGRSGAGGGALNDYWRVWNSTNDPLTGVANLHGTFSWTSVTGSFHAHNVDLSSLTNGNGYFVTYNSSTNAPLTGHTRMLMWGTGAP